MNVYLAGKFGAGDSLEDMALEIDAFILERTHSLLPPNYVMCCYKLFPVECGFYTFGDSRICHLSITNELEADNNCTIHAALVRISCFNDGKISYAR